VHLVRRGEAVDAEAADGEPVAEKRCGGGRSRGAWSCGNKQESGHNIKQDEQDKEGRWTDREYLGEVACSSPGLTLFVAVLKLFSMRARKLTILFT